MRLYQVQILLLDLDNTLLFICYFKIIIFLAKCEIYHLGWVLPSNNMFTSDGASLINKRVKFEKS